MKQKIFITLLLLSEVVAMAQDSFIKKEDISAPKENAGFSSFGKVVNESSGKINLSFPIATISARNVDFPLSLSYDGTNVIKQATYTARHMSTGILGVGWTMGVPKIIADTKNTGSRDDDMFYLNGSELVCVKRGYEYQGYRIWEFKPNNGQLYIVKYYESFNTPQPQILDYWEVIDDKGFIFKYGFTDNTRESVLAWGNWIGDGKGDAALKHTSAWNLESITDQYSNKLSFSYLKVEQGFSAVSPKHTEASYLKSISSSTGEQVVFEYANKNPFEYYEPHTEAPEPDAYQEHYEKNYLTNIKTYNSESNLISNFEMNYDLVNSSTREKAKRYLIGVTEKNAADKFLPSNRFEYNMSGDFTGLIRKWIKPEGGALLYNYNKKFLFKHNNTIVTNGIREGLWASYTSEDYRVSLHTDAYGGSNSGSGQGNFSLVQDTWNGRKWIRTKFAIPQTIRYKWVGNSWETLDNAKFVFSQDFYAALVYDRNTDRGSIYLFHKLKEGGWSQYPHVGLFTGGIDDNNASDDPVLISGENFVAIGVKRSGDLYTYTWRDTSWSHKHIQQGDGVYYYSASNNFIIAANTNTGIDMAVTIGPQNTETFKDRYYFHYLDGESVWQTRSWSKDVTAVVSDISTPSAFYPSNSMSSFVAGNNPEFFLRWYSDYSLPSTRIDNVLGNFNDFYPIFPVGNNIFSCQHVGDPNDGYCFSAKQAAFTGSQWIINNQVIWSNNGFGVNMLSGVNNGIKVHNFDPNTSQWTYTSLPNGAGESGNTDSFASSNDLFLAEDRLYRINNWGFEEALILDPYFDRQEFVFSGGSYLYGHSTRVGDPLDSNNNGSTTDRVGNMYYYYMDKTSNEVRAVLLLNTYQNLWSQQGLSNIRAQQFGGKYPHFSNTVLRTSKLIDNLVGQDIFDVVLSEVTTDDGLGNLSKVSYSYGENSHSLPNGTVIFDIVTKTEIGTGTGTTNGYTKMYFDTGVNDFTRAGILDKVEIYDNNNFKVADEIYTYRKSLNYIRDALYNVKKSNVVYRLIVKVENSYVGGLSSNTLNYTYNDEGKLIYSDKINSLGVKESSTLSYADASFSFVRDKNLKGFLHKKVNKIGLDVVSVEKINWMQNGNNVFISDSSSGPSEDNIRVNNKIELVDSYGNILQTSNGLGLYKSVLMGYNNKYVVASIPNVTHSEILNALDISYLTLQSYSTAQLKTELTKLYNRFPMVTIDLFDSNGRKVTSIDARKNEINYIYDQFGRLKYTTDKNGKIIEIRTYRYKNQVD